MGDTVMVVIYPEGSAPLRFERCWDVVDDVESDSLHFSFKELEVTMYADFDKSKLVGFSVEV